MPEVHTDTQVKRLRTWLQKHQEERLTDGAFCLLWQYFHTNSACFQRPYVRNGYNAYMHALSQKNVFLVVTFALVSVSVHVVHAHTFQAKRLMLHCSTRPCVIGAKGKLLSTIQSYFKAGLGTEGLEEHTKVMHIHLVSDALHTRHSVDI